MHHFKDSKNLIVLDENVKNKSLNRIFLKAVSFLCFVALTVSPIAHTILVEIDHWFGGDIMHQAIFLLVISVVLFVLVVIWFYKRYVR